MKSLLRFAMISGLFAASGGAAFAQTATYTFEAPAFTLGSSSPGGLNNKAPNVGSVGVTASFTSSPLTNKAEIDDNHNGVNNPGGTPYFSSQFSGQFLDSIATNQTITVTLNTAFTNLTLDFYLDSPGMLNFGSASGSASQIGTYDAATADYIGTLNFNSATPFTSFTLVTAGTGGGARPAGFGIDNLQLSTVASAVPAPGSAMVLGVGLLYPLAGLARRRKSKVA